MNTDHVMPVSLRTAGRIAALAHSLGLSEAEVVAQAVDRMAGDDDDGMDAAANVPPEMAPTRAAQAVPTRTAGQVAGRPAYWPWRGGR